MWSVSAMIALPALRAILKRLSWYQSVTIAGRSYSYAIGFERDCSCTTPGALLILRDSNQSVSSLASIVTGSRSSDTPSSTPNTLFWI